MNETLTIVLVLLSGIALGILFFAGLWLTVKKIVSVKNPTLLVFASFIIRMGITLVGFYFIGDGNMQKLLICLMGFIAGRFMVAQFIKKEAAKNASIKTEVKHEV